MEYHAHKYVDYSLLVFDNKTLIAVLPAHSDESILYSHQGLTYGGLVYKANLKFKGVLNAFKAILFFLEQKQIKLLVLKTIPQIYFKSADHSLDYIFNSLNAKLNRIDILSVVIPQQKKYSNSRKEGSRRGLKHNLHVEETDDFSQFWNEILIPNLKQKHNTVPVHNLEEIMLLKSKFKSQIRQFNVYHNQKLVAGTTIFESENVAHSQYISGNANKNEIGSLDFLHIYLLENVFQNKLYFDFGTSNVNGGKQINDGLLFWKQGFGANIITQNFYEIEIKNHLFLDNIFV